MTGMDGRIKKARGQGMKRLKSEIIESQNESFDRDIQWYTHFTVSEWTDEKLG